MQTEPETLMRTCIKSAFNEVLKRFPLYKLHCVEIIVARPSEVEDRGDVCVANTGGRTRLAQKTKPRRFVTEISLADDFRCHGTAQIDIDRFVSHSHGAATEIDRLTG